MRKGHPRFYELLEQIADLHERKNSDYAEDNDPLSNLRQCKQIGLPAWKGVIVRLMDKWDRTKRLTIKGEAAVKSETLTDTLMDTAVYSLLCIVLLEEAEEEVKLKG